MLRKGRTVGEPLSAVQGGQVGPNGLVVWSCCADLQCLFVVSTAPEVQTSSLCSIVSDMFSLGLVVCAIFNQGRPLIQANHSSSAYMKQLEVVSNWAEHCLKPHGGYSMPSAANLTEEKIPYFKLHIPYGDPNRPLLYRQHEHLCTKMQVSLWSVKDRA
jgi:hypothetical protein